MRHQHGDESFEGLSDTRPDRDRFIEESYFCRVPACPGHSGPKQWCFPQVTYCREPRCRGHYFPLESCETEQSFRRQSDCPGHEPL